MGIDTRVFDTAGVDLGDSLHMVFIPECIASRSPSCTNKFRGPSGIAQLEMLT